MGTFTSTPEGAAPTTPVTEIELAIGGMTCASCATRIEKKLNKLDGVTATVNYATEKARVTAPEGVDPDDLVAQVEATGYTAALPRRAAAGDGEPTPTSADATRRLRDRLDRLSAAGGAGDRAGDGAGAAVHLLAVALADAGRAGRRPGGRGRSTGPPGRTCATAPPPWTR